MATIALKSGAKMPLVGFGLWKIPRDICADTVYAALQAGYRLLDGACDYGNEKEAGEGLRRAIADGIVKREEVFITTKARLWNTFHKREHAHAIVKKQLADWGVDYFDLYLIHFPIAIAYVDPAHRYPPEWFGDDGKVYLQNTPIQETWEAMEEILDAGLAKDIGVSNFNGSLICDLLRYAKRPLSALQIEHHPYLTQDALIKFAQSQGIAVTGYSSLGPASWLEIDMHHHIPALLKHNTITSIAQAHGKSPAQVLLRWTTQRGIAIVPKSNSPARLLENFNSTDFDLTAEQLEQISSLNQNIRLNNPGEGIDQRLSIFA
ncbi:NAD(P)H-dependent D-xylose reductase (XR) [Tulasnella sp. UAMH 9824]|nr:NAD(P)H-dependent D-xylose reductase (XR) [Tulasnella sp. UAMH 9824]